MRHLHFLSNLNICSKRQARLLFPTQLMPLLGVLIMLFGGAQAATVEVLRMAPGAWLFGPVAVYTVGSTSTTMFFPLSEPMPLGDITNARFAYQMTQDTGDCKLRGAVRFSNDGVNWDPEGQVSATYSDSEAEIIWVSNVDLTNVAGTTPHAFIQFGVQTVNRSGSSFAFCHAALRVEPRRH